MIIRGEVPERPKGSDCKSDGAAFVGSNPALPTSKGARALRLDNIRVGYAGVA